MKKESPPFKAWAAAVSTLVLLPLAAPALSAADTRPNILWIVAEDQSPRIGDYDETPVETPSLDAMADEGIRFSAAYVTSPVCSTSRSALITGMYPTTLGTHNHRSQRKAGNRDSNADPTYAPSYRLPVKSVIELFREHGYYVSNQGKTDYNFVSNEPLPRTDWTARKEGQPFFTQIQLRGGKDGRQKYSRSYKLSGTLNLPPYYPEDTVMLNHWTRYLQTWINTDHEVAKILTALEKDGLLENTAVFFITDHGVSSLRGKQFCYEEGVRIPMIVRLPNKELAGTVRDDLVQQIDLAATSLQLAGIPIPDYIDGRALFDGSEAPRDYIVCARDRCGDPIDTIRSVRKGRYKYIRNFISFRPHSQRDQYKDSHKDIRHMRELHAAGEMGRLSKLQARPFDPIRPPEELYDLVNDPYETVNLAAQAAFRATLFDMRQTLYDWMVETKDMGLIPEPILEDWGREVGNKYHILQEPSNQGLVKKLIHIMEAGELRDLDTLMAKLDSPILPEQYWAITWLGVHRASQAVQPLRKLSDSENATIRVAANLALCQLGQTDAYLPKLIEDVDAPNSLVGMYALDAIEQTNILNDAVKQAAKVALKSEYDNNTRYARRLMNKFGVSSKYYVPYDPALYAYLHQPYQQAQAYLPSPQN